MTPVTPKAPFVCILMLTVDSSLAPINTRRAQTETIFEEPFAPTSPRSGGPPPASSSSAHTTSTSSSSSTATLSGQLPPQSPTSLSFLSEDPNPTTDFPPNYNLSRRTSVSAESLAPSTNSSPSVRRTSSGPVKTAQQQARIRSAISANLLFKNLDDEQTRDVLDAMTEKKIPKEGVVVIHQGDVGDFFYVVEEGGFDFYIRKQGGAGEKHGLGDRVGGVGAGGSFGELALMYNAPRAASVVSTSPGVLWALDRITFRRILMAVPTPSPPHPPPPPTRNLSHIGYLSWLIGSTHLGNERCMRRFCLQCHCCRASIPGKKPKSQTPWKRKSLKVAK